MTAGERTPHTGPGLPVGVNIAGYFDSALGVGEAARQVRGALERAGVATASITLPERRSRGPGQSRPPQEPPFPATLICANADAMEGAWDWLGPRFLESRTIAMWWWEVEVFPERWQRAFDGLDEVWVGSRFVADAIAPTAPVPVLTMPVPVVAREPSSLTREELGLPEGFLFLFTFDFASGFERKNPLGVIDAFTRAFPGGSGASLAIKHIGSEGHEAEAARLEEAAAGHPDVHLVGGHLPAQDQAALTAACDCYVSLHRSEGFGLTLAEAVLARRPVVATGYSGPMDFLGSSTAFLVDYELAPVGPGNDPYPVEARWARPDLDQAGRLMREVCADPEHAAQRAERALARLDRSTSPSAAGGAMSRRLARLQGLPPDRAGSSGSLDLTELERRVAADFVNASNPLRRLIGRLSERITRPRAVHQRRVDEELVRAVRSLDERVQGLANAQATLAARLDAERHADEGSSEGR